MASRLSRIDDLSRDDHFYLASSDRCLFYGEFTAGAGFNKSRTNQLIYNLKKSPSRRDKPEWQHKEKAIEEIGGIFARCMPSWALDGDATFVPIPPSKARDHPEYDDRMGGVLTRMAEGRSTDIRYLVEQRESTRASHASGDDRMGPDALYENYRFRSELFDDPVTTVILVDDVLTTGAHFKAMQRVIVQHVPNVDVLGLFVARRIFESPFAPVE